MIQEAKIKFWAYQRIKRYGEHSKAMLQLCNTAKLSMFAAAISKQE